MCSRCNKQTTFRDKNTVAGWGLSYSTVSKLRNICPFEMTDTLRPSQFFSHVRDSFIDVRWTFPHLLDRWKSLIWAQSIYWPFIRIDCLTGLPLGGCTLYIMSQNLLRTPKLHIKDIPRTSENSLVRPKMDIETSCLQKKPAHIYQITRFMSRLHIGFSLILFIDNARTSHLTDFESFIDSQGGLDLAIFRVLGVRRNSHINK